MAADLVEEQLRLPVRKVSRSYSLIGTLVRPVATQRALPCLLLLHEVFGVTPSLRVTAAALAREGYAVFTPDLYHGRRPALALARLVAGVAVRPLRNQTLSDLRWALAAIATLPGVDARRLGVIGYSMGAAYALQLACVEPTLRVAAAFCGQLPRPLDALRRSCPVVASYAGRDATCRGIGPRLDRVLTRYGIAHDVKIYSTVAHAFYDPFGPMYNAVVARDAWERTLTFLGAQVRGSP